jgi:metal-responsive CopG/Arc/MetJ family transcriptional regulator
VPRSRPFPQKARRSKLCHITVRIPQRLLEKIDGAAIENNLGRSDVIRSVLSRANYGKKPKP